MFCTKCGKSIADGSGFCPECGQDLRIPAAEKIQESAQEPVTPVITAAPATAQEYVTAQASAEAESSSAAQASAPAQVYSAAQESAPAWSAAPPQSSDTGSKISAFFKEYFKSPITAVSSHATHEFWLWGLISVSAYLLLHFLISLIGFGSIRGFGLQFGYLIGDIVRFATLVFAYFLFQGVFKLKKKSLTAVIALVGLAFLPILPLYVVGLALDRILIYSSILSALFTAVYVFAGIIMYSELKESSEDKSGARSLLTVAISFACMPLISGVIDTIVYRIYIF